MLTWAEIRRSRGRFASIIAALALISFLVLMLSGLADGLYYGATGAVRAGNADAYAFNSQTPGSLTRSQLPDSDVALLRSTPGVKAASGLGLLLTSGGTPSGLTDMAIFGVGSGEVGMPANLLEGRLPRAEALNEAAADEKLLSSGVRIGSSIAVGAVAVIIVGVTRDSSYQLQPSVWTSLATLERMRAAVRPETRGVTGQVNAVALQLEPGTSISGLDAALPGVDVISAIDTGLAIPGVAQQRASLSAIIYASLIVAVLVVALFFALIVLEKRELFAALKAIGASTWRLARSVVMQAVIASIVGLVIGALAARVLGAVIPARVPVLFRTDTLIDVGVFVITAGVVGALLSLRRIARIDPATALGGAT